MTNAYFTLQNLTGPTSKDISTTFQRMSELIRDDGEPGQLLVQILDGPESSHWTITISQDGTRLTTEKNEHADFEIITTADTWWQIATGTLSPLKAFLQGDLRITGDYQWGKKILQQLKKSENR
ncbi:MAG TPA: SCP2 sterol-binding domain-containing protein [Chitinophaga sp.]|uniref:SCP2 sterol-binding domain-containing protein n=1 Tax=Chitinophaga sp. TaxID=1869181 RepID=UPI002CF02CAE|nr:SCP2 sterol-binding domain-containing protein [Chitinophaga sp.]HVI43745.1 SCP2 sterol-binding domain-containing protein [Chitinophaga sp.]